jgi:hypothetical protein
MIDFIIGYTMVILSTICVLCIVLFILSPVYNFWIVSKNDIDTESELYISVRKAVEEAEGDSIEIKLVIGGVED